MDSPVLQRHRKYEVSIPLDEIKEGLCLKIYSKTKSIEEVESEGDELEAPVQLVEGHFYDYEFSDEKYRFDKHVIVDPHSKKPYIGKLQPNIYVGTIPLKVLGPGGLHVETYPIEVQSIKSSYREDYRFMLGEIVDQAIELILNSSEDITQNLSPDYSSNDKAKDYQKFTFIRSILENESFFEAIHQICSNPTTKWVEQEESQDIRKLRRISNKDLQQAMRGANQTKLNNARLNALGLKSLATHIHSSRKVDSVDTSENRFVKYVLFQFSQFCGAIKKRVKNDSQLYIEASRYEQRLEQCLQHSLFSEVGNIQQVNFNSPVLQRKSGYREVLKSWLMFEIAAKLTWTGGDDVYAAGKKNVAVLYEYWVFFKLLKLLQSTFHITAKSLKNLIGTSGSGGLDFNIKKGTFIPLKGSYNSGSRDLTIEFSFNKTFSRNKDYDRAGSWTVNMIPDYTLSIWPTEFGKAAEAEKANEIVHIHFDAKYKIKHIDLLKESNSDEEENTSPNSRDFKRIDLLKMHAYKDAIRRTAGAYVLYPGEKAGNPLRGFHELLPGLGAFTLRPNKDNDGSKDLNKFILDIIEHFENRSTHRERIAYANHTILKTENNYKSDGISLPELIKDEKLIPDDTAVIMAYSVAESPEELTHEFHIPIDSDTATSISEITQARFLMRYSDEEHYTNKLFYIASNKPRISSSDSGGLNIEVDLESIDEKSLTEAPWSPTSWPEFSTRKPVGYPFSVKLSKLL
ncbi:MAG: DUF2357 domain-containing protein [Flavobacteriaceae bacterium]